MIAGACIAGLILLGLAALWTRGYAAGRPDRDAAHEWESLVDRAIEPVER